jgi:hypothetical protein
MFGIVILRAYPKEKIGAQCDDDREKIAFPIFIGTGYSATLHSQ